jgi:hypothetical protein
VTQLDTGGARSPAHVALSGLIDFGDMTKLLLKGVRYIKCYSELTFGGRPDTLEGTIDYCVDRPILMAQARSEIVQLAKILQASAPRRSLEIGTNYGGTLFLLCTLSPPDAKIISVDLPSGPFGGGYPRRKVPLFRRFPRKASNCTLFGRTPTHPPQGTMYYRFSMVSDLIIYFLTGITPTRA